MGNIISRTGIEGFDYTWNPVYGCLTGCSYCWARQCVKRFAVEAANREINWWMENRRQELLEDNRDLNLWREDLINGLRKFSPLWLESKFNLSFPKKPARIIVGWMSDIAYWQPEWMERVLRKIREYPQHTFFFLTKNSGVYPQYLFPKNCWLGVTITGREMNANWLMLNAVGMDNTRFVSIEPLFCLLNEYELPSLARQDWIIIGAQTGSGEKVIPKREWVEAIINQARLLRIPVYLKDNLLKAVPGLPRLKEIPG